MFEVERIDEPTLGPWVRGSDTSREAAHDNYPRSGSQRRRILDEVASAGPNGLTREEIATSTGIVLNSVLPRVVELVDRGLIEQSGATRRTRLGCKAAVLIVSEVGR